MTFMNGKDWFELGFGGGVLFSILTGWCYYWLFFRDKLRGSNAGLVHPTSPLPRFTAGKVEPTIPFPPPPEPTAEQLDRWAKTDTKIEPLPGKPEPPTFEMTEPPARPMFGHLIIPDDARLKGDSNLQHRPDDYWRRNWQPPPQM